MKAKPQRPNQYFKWPTTDIGRWNRRLSAIYENCTKLENWELAAMQKALKDLSDLRKG